jgi:hypothetical protein
MPDAHYGKSSESGVREEKIGPPAKKPPKPHNMVGKVSIRETTIVETMTDEKITM